METELDLAEISPDGTMLMLGLVITISIFTVLIIIQNSEL